MSMEIQVLKSFLIMTTFFNLTILLFWTVAFSLFKNATIKIQKKFIDIDPKSIESTIYFLLGFYKILILFFNIIPLLALFLTT